MSDNSIELNFPLKRFSMNKPPEMWYLTISIKKSMGNNRFKLAYESPGGIQSEELEVN